MAVRKKQSKAAKRPASKKALSQGDLQEFRLRHQALLVATHQQMLVKESYDQWLQRKGTEYGAKGQFEVSLQTGEITQRG